MTKPTGEKPSKPVKPVKPVKAWALMYDGEIDFRMIFHTRTGAREWKADGNFTGPIRVEIRPVR